MADRSFRGSFCLLLAGLTDKGQLRAQNEDNILLLPELGVYVVADGMGGHNAGKLASILVTKSIANYFEATEYELGKGDDESAKKRLIDAVGRANQNVFEISSTHKEHEGMGSTVVSLHAPASGKVMHIGHVGDSRCYRLRDRKLTQLTEDHSLVNEVRSLRPTLSESDLSRLPKNVVTRALGMKATVDVDTRTEELVEGDTYLLCSDGLSGMVKDADIERTLLLAADPSEACTLLVNMANDAGGLDNISALVVRVATAGASR